MVVGNYKCKVTGRHLGHTPLIKRGYFCIADGLLLAGVQSILDETSPMPWNPLAKMNASYTNVMSDLVSSSHTPVTRFRHDGDQSWV